MGFTFDRLNQSVRGKRTDPQTGAGFFDGLVVEAVDFCLFPDEMGEKRLFPALDQVRWIMPERGVGTMVKEARMFGQILIDGAAAGEI